MAINPALQIDKQNLEELKSIYQEINALKNSVVEFVKGWFPTTEKNNSEIKSVFDNLKNPIKQVSSLFSKGFDKIGNTFNSVKDAVANVNSTIVKANPIKKLTSTLTNTFSTVKDKLKPSNLFGNMFDKLKSGFSLLGKMMPKPPLKFLSDKFSAITSKITGGINKLKDKLTNKKENKKEDNSLDSLSKPLESISKSVSLIAKSVVYFLVGPGLPLALIKAAVPIMVIFFGLLILSLYLFGDTIAKIIGPIFDGIKPILEGIGEAIKLAAEWLFKGGGQVILDALSKLVAVIAEWIPKLLPVLEIIAESIGILVKTVTHLISDIVVPLVSKLLDIVVKLLEVVVDVILEILKAAADLVVTIINIVTTLGNLIVDTLKLLKKPIEIIVKIINVVGETILMICELVKKIAGNALTWVAGKALSFFIDDDEQEETTQNNQAASTKDLILETVREMNTKMVTETIIENVLSKIVDKLITSLSSAITPLIEALKNVKIFIKPSESEENNQDQTKTTDTFTQTIEPLLEINNVIAETVKGILNHLQNNVIQVKTVENNVTDLSNTAINSDASGINNLNNATIANVKNSETERNQKQDEINTNLMERLKQINNDMNRFFNAWKNHTNNISVSESWSVES